MAESQRRIVSSGVKEAQEVRGLKEPLIAFTPAMQAMKEQIKGRLLPLHEKTDWAQRRRSLPPCPRPLRGPIPPVRQASITPKKPEQQFAARARRRTFASWREPTGEA